jgi:hypothetical protein
MREAHPPAHYGSHRRDPKSTSAQALCNHELDVIIMICLIVEYRISDETAGDPP